MKGVHELMETKRTIGAPDCDATSGIKDALETYVLAWITRSAERGLDSRCGGRVRSKHSVIPYSTKMVQLEKYKHVYLFPDAAPIPLNYWAYVFVSKDVGLYLPSMMWKASSATKNFRSGMFEEEHAVKEMW